MSKRIRTIEINASRLIDASPEAVYEVWLDKSCPGSPWFGVPKVIIDPKVDGLFYSMYKIEGREIAHYGRFITLDMYHKIQYTWVSEATHGMETMLTVSFDEMNGKTQVSIQHTNVPDDEGGHRHQHAWAFVLNRISSHFNGEKK